MNLSEFYVLLNRIFNVLLFFFDIFHTQKKILLAFHNYKTDSQSKIYAKFMADPKNHVIFR